MMCACIGDKPAFNTRNTDLPTGLLVARDAETTGIATHSRMLGPLWPNHMMEYYTARNKSKRPQCTRPRSDVEK